VGERKSAGDRDRSHRTGERKRRDHLHLAGEREINDAVGHRHIQHARRVRVDNGVSAGRIAKRLL